MGSLLCAQEEILPQALDWTFRTKNKKGEEKFRKSEVDHFYPGNPIVLIYLLEKFYGTKWAKDFEKLQIARAKLESKEEWNNGSDNDGNTES